MVVKGFGGNPSEPIEHLTTITFQNSAQISCNIVPEKFDAFLAALDRTFQTWHEKEWYKNELSAPVPRKEEKVNFLIEIKGMFDLMYKTTSKKIWK